jgi:hypothetical protein
MNAPSPIVVSEAGIVTAVSPVASNAVLPIVVRFDGVAKETDVKLDFPENAESAKLVTGFPVSVAGIVMAAGHVLVAQPSMRMVDPRSV